MKKSTKLGLATKCIHTGDTLDERGGIFTPLYNHSTFGFSDTQSVLDVVEGRVEGNLYTRYGLNPTIQSLEKKIGQLDDQSNQRQRELRQQILDQSKNLDDDMRQKYESILSVIDREVQELRSDKTDRSTLAALLTQVAMQLNNEFEMPKNQ